MGVFSVKFLLISTAVVLFIGDGINKQLEKYAVFTETKTDTDTNMTCSVVGAKEMSNSEDTVMGKHGLVFISVGNLQHIFNHGTEKAELGGVFVYNIHDKTHQSLTKLRIDNYPAERKVFFHGIYISNATDRVYAVNHVGTETTVEVFSVRYSPKCIKVEGGAFSCPPAVLTHMRTVRSSLFDPYTLNDVAEGKISTMGGEFYVTRWLINAKPEHGDKGVNTTMKQKLSLFLNDASVLAGYRHVGLYRCSWEGDGNAECEIATEFKMLMPNGITISPDRRFVFVADVGAIQLIVFKRQDNGQLLHHATHATPYPIDNIEYIDGSIIGVGVYQLWKVALNMISKHAINYKVPGAILRMSDGQWGAMEFDELFVHDGEMHSQSSMGIVYGNRIIVGGPFSRGMLVCDRN